MKFKHLHLTVLFLLLLGITGLHAQNCNNMMLTSRTYSEKVNFQSVIKQEFGPNSSIVDWEDLKSIRNIDAWISCIGLRNEQSFMVTRRGQFIFQGKRQYNVQYFASGRAPANYLVHDQIGKLFLGSWYDLNSNILVTVKKNQNCENFKMTSQTYSEKINFQNIIRQEFGPNSTIADWEDLKSIRNIDAWIACMGLQNEQSFMVTRRGQFIFQGKRQYNVQYFASGKAPANYLIHDQIGKLFLGSWYDLNSNILVTEKGGLNPEKPSQNCGDFKMTSQTYTEKVDLISIIQQEFGRDYTIADWDGLKSIPNVDAWIACLGLQNGQTFMVTKGGKNFFSNNRQYFVLYTSSGQVPAGFLVHERIGTKLVLGSWFGEKRNILAVKAGGPEPRGEMSLTINKYLETQNLKEAIHNEFRGKGEIVDWNDLKAITDIDSWASRIKLQPNGTCYVIKNGQSIFNNNRQYFVLYAPNGQIPSGFLVHEKIGNKLFLGSWFGEKRPVLVKGI